jgi:hypothetical protein
MATVANTRRPRRDPDWTINRPTDGELVEVWTYTRSRRSRDRVIDGTPVYGTIAAVAGAITHVSPCSARTPDAALNAVKRMFGEAPATS